MRVAPLSFAACTTATGREMIMLAKEYVETNYNADVIYGDSVMPYTPITYKINNDINVLTVSSSFNYNLSSLIIRPQVTISIDVNEKL